MTSVTQRIKNLTAISVEITDFLQPLTDEMKRIRAGVSNLRWRLQNLGNGQSSVSELQEKIWPKYDRLLEDFEEEKKVMFSCSTRPI